MIIEHLGKKPHIDANAWVAPDATICGDVRLDAGVRVQHGARVIAEGGHISIGQNSIIMENAVVRATEQHDCSIGNAVLVGPNAHVVGSTIEDEVFLATGVSIFHASTLGRGSAVRINGIVHVNTVLPENGMVPIGWIAVGNPAQIFSPDQHDALWEAQKTLEFPKTAYGLDRNLGGNMTLVTEIVSKRLGTHKDDKEIA